MPSLGSPRLVAVQVNVFVSATATAFSTISFTPLRRPTESLHPHPVFLQHTDELALVNWSLGPC